MFIDSVKKSFTFRLLHRIIIEGYKSSALRQSVLGIRHSITYKVFAKLGNIIKAAFLNSFLFTIIKPFVNADIDWNESFFYKLFTVPFAAIIRFCSKIVGKRIPVAIKKSLTVNLVETIGKQSIFESLYIISLMLAFMSGIYAVLLITTGNINTMTIMIAAASILFALLTAIMKHTNLYAAFDNSIAIKFVRGAFMAFWSDNE